MTNTQLIWTAQSMELLALSLNDADDHEFRLKVFLLRKAAVYRRLVEKSTNIPFIPPKNGMKRHWRNQSNS